MDVADKDRVARIVAQRLEGLQRAGVTHLPKARARKSTSPAELEQSATPEGATSDLTRAAAREQGLSAADIEVACHAPPAPEGIVERSLFDPTQQSALPLDERIAALQIISREVAGCTRCPVLVANRTQTVFGVGNPMARVCFFGEAPGADEDRKGEPFVGRAGQLLDKMIVACKMQREDVYILNVLKCRPPENRNPLPEEAANCRGYFERQLEIIRPEIICCLGTVAAQALLCTDRGIGKLRGRFHEYRGTPVVCTYHPAYLLRNPAAKTDAWEDLKLMMRRLGMEL